MSEVDRPSFRPPVLPVLGSLPKQVQVIPPTPNIPAAVLPNPKNRTFTPDLTGYWESPRVRTNVNDISPILVQINQAGGVAVLWFTRPPPGITGVDYLELPIVNRNKPTRDWVYGVASAVVRDLDERDCLSAGASLSWIALLNPKSGNPNTSDRFNVLDPSNLYRPPEGVDLVEGNGQLRGDGSRLMLEFGEIATTPYRVELVKVRPGARLPRTIIDTIPQPLRTSILIDTVRPVPSKLERYMLSLFDPLWAKGTPRMAPLLKAWKEAPENQIARDAPRSNIGKALRFGLQEPWRKALLDRMALAARTNVLTIEDETKSYADWLNMVLDDEEKATREQRLESSKLVLDPIRELGIGASDTFAYTLKFHDIGGKASLPGPADIGGFGGYVVLVEITKEAIALERDSKGNVKYDDAGKAIIKPSSRRPVPWMRSADNVAGVFVRIDSGLSIKNTKFMEQPKPPTPDEVLRKAAETKNYRESVGTAELGTVEFRSSLDLAGTDDFAGALFTISSLVVDKAKAGNFVKAQALDSALWEMRLSGGSRLSAIVEGEHYKEGKLVPSNVGSVGSVSWWKNWTPQASWEFAPLRVSLGYGWLLAKLPSKSTDSQPSGRARQPVTQRDFAASVTAELQSFFEYNSHMLEDPKWPDLRALPRRLRLEERLAEIRSVLALPGGAVLLLGMTSPEGDSKANDTLSQNRAVAVEQAIKDALGPVFARTTVVRHLGEGPAKARGRLFIDRAVIEPGQLPDPEDFPTREAYFADSKRRRQAEEWTKWRRVDVYVEGKLLIRLFTRENPAAP